MSFTSTNAGATWEINYSLGMREARSLACSADGNKLAAASHSYGTFVSVDSAATWTSTGLSYGRVACSADGRMLVVANADGIFTSTNLGTSWISNNAPSLNWSAVASSADGQKLVAAVNGGGIWTSQTTAQPELNLTPTESGFLISWVVPSMPFVLQESADLTTSNWTDVTTMPILNFTNLHHEVSVPLSSANRFYRLKCL